jgi:V/A-type H+-transporting ATPase subunit I
MSQASAEPRLSALRLTGRQLRHVGYLRVGLEDVEEALGQLGPVALSAPPPPTPERPLHHELRAARRARRAASAVATQIRALAERRERLEWLSRAFDAFVALGVPGRTNSTRTFYLVLGPQAAREGTAQLEQALSEALGAGIALHSRILETGDLAVAITADVSDAEQLEAVLSELGVNELELPEACVQSSPEAGREALALELGASKDEQTALDAQRQSLAEWLVPELHRVRATLRDALDVSEALQTAAATEHLVILEGWLPESKRPALDQALAETEGERIVVEDLARETWSARDAPVEIRNPRIFRPFEVITRWLPLPRYGSIDPTPLVAVFFPMFFGLMLGDLGYGAILGTLALVGWSRSDEGSLLRSLCEIAATCAAFSLIFGVLFGELFGDLGRQLFGLRAVAFSREEAFIPFLCLALAIGFVHVVLGLVLGALASFRSDRRQSLGRGLAAIMVVLTAAVLLAALNLLPGALFTPAAVALLLSFPLLIAVEGVVGPIEFLSKLGNVLSYARIMALGTASVMLAIAANHMAGTLGGVAVGVLFATLFHLVNFVIGVFSPTVHALRLQFVEFYGTFYSPGGMVYRPLRHASADGASTPSSS